MPGDAMICELVELFRVIQGLRVAWLSHAPTQ